MTDQAAIWPGWCCLMRASSAWRSWRVNFQSNRLGDLLVVAGEGVQPVVDDVEVGLRVGGATTARALVTGLDRPGLLPGGV